MTQVYVMRAMGWASTCVRKQPAVFELNERRLESGVGIEQWILTCGLPRGHHPQTFDDMALGVVAHHLVDELHGGRRVGALRVDVQRVTLR